MTNTVKILSAIFLIVLHLGAAFALNVAHSHAFTANFNSPAKLEAHGCGADEVHQKIPPSHTCLLCVRAFLFAAIFAPMKTLCTVPVVVGELATNHLDCQSGHNVSCPKRGPPLPCS
jgi:hypothetical protein